MLSFILLASSATSLTDVSSKFYNYAHGFCNGNVHNADIGNGNLLNNNRYSNMLGHPAHAEAMQLGVEHSKLSFSKMVEVGIKPGSNGTTLSSCNEKDGNTCRKDGGVYHWCNYSGYKCMSKYAGQEGEVKYYNMAKSTGAPEFLTMYYDNDIGTESIVNITKRMETTNKQTISTTYGFEIGASMSITAGEPGIFSVTDTFTWSFDWHKTTTNTKITSSWFEWAGQIPEDAYSTTLLDLEIAKERYTGDWKAEIKLPYYAKLWCNSRVNGHYEHFVSARTFMGAGPYYGKGVFTGGQGLSIHATVQKCPLYSTTSAECSGTVKALPDPKKKQKLKASPCE